MIQIITATEVSTLLMASFFFISLTVGIIHFHVKACISTYSTDLSFKETVVIFNSSARLAYKR